MCDLDPNRDPNLQRALDLWGAEHGCSCVDVERDENFKRVWLFCFVMSLVPCVLVTLPLCWASDNKDNDDFMEVDAEAAGQKKRKMREEEDDDIGGPEPDLQKAKEHLRKTSATVGGKWLGIFSTSVGQLSEIGGVGTELYFRLLRRLGLCFVYMAAMTCASAALNSFGSFAPDNGQFLARTTIGNIGAGSGDSLIAPDQRYIVLKHEGGCQGIPATTMTKMIGWLDLGSIALFIGFLVIFRFVSVPKVAKLADQNDITPKDYAVEIDKLPREFSGMEEMNKEGKTRYEVELSQLLCERMTTMRKKDKSCKEACDVKVEELVLVRDWGGRLHDIKRKATMLKDEEIAKFNGNERKAEKLGKKLDKLTEKLDKRLKPEEELPVVRAFAIVSTSTDAHRLIVDYRFSVYTLVRMLQQCFANLGCISGGRLFKGRYIRIRQAPEPTNIIWENQDVKYSMRLLRSGIMSLVFLIIVLISFGLVYAANAGAKKNMESSNQLLGMDSCDPDTAVLATENAYECFITNATSWTLDFVKSSSADVKSCYCGTLGHAAVIQSSELMNGVCKDWLLSNVTGVALAAIASAIVVAINIVCNFILRTLAEWERPLSESALNSSKMVKIWALQTLNTGFVIFCVNFAAPKGFPLGNIIFVGEYNDAVRGWYTVVGTAVLTNMLANSVVPAATNTAVMVSGSFMRCCCARRKKHQAELVELYTNPPFDIAARYAQLLTVVFVTMTYSAGLPLLNIFAAAYMLFTYWADKVVLLWGSRRPPAYDTTTSREASEYMLYAVAVHCVFAIWMYGQPCTFPSNPLGGTLASMTEQATSTATGSGGAYGSMAADSGLVERLTKESTWMFFLLLLICTALWTLWTVLWILGGTVGELGKCIWLCLCPARGKVRPESEDAADSYTWTQAQERIERICPPASYAMVRHPAFKVQAAFLGTAKNTGLFQKRTPPVDAEVAKLFLAALSDEYVGEVDQAVGNFFDSKHIQPDIQEALGRYEQLVRNAADDNKDEAKEAIGEIAEKWGMVMPKG